MLDRMNLLFESQFERWLGRLLVDPNVHYWKLQKVENDVLLSTFVAHLLVEAGP